MRKGIQILKILVLFLLFGLFASGTIPSACLRAEAAEAGSETVLEGWQTNAAGKKQYYVNGEKATGLKKIGSKWYFFDNKGIMRTGTVQSGNWTYYLNSKGVLEARKKGTKTYYYSKKSKVVKQKGKSAVYYYANGKKMSKTDAADFDTSWKAQIIVNAITTSKMSKAKKLKTCFEWVMAKNYKTWRKFSPKKGWPATYASDHFDTGWGECHADAAAFAYLAKALGYKKVYVCNDCDGSGGRGHSWAEVNGKVYDPLFAQAKSYKKNYGVSYKTYSLRAILHVKLSSSLSPASVTSVQKITIKKTSGDAGTTTASAENLQLKKENGSWYLYENGEPVKNAWKTVNGKKYYFQADGAAATLSTKINGTYYVFSKSGVLYQPSGKKIVTIGSDKYLVSSKGKAMKGWYRNKTYYFDKTGKMVKGWNSSKTFYFNKTTGKKLTGAHVINDKFYVFGSNGKYNKTKTAKLRKAAKYQKSFSGIQKILGAPKKIKYYGSSCFAYKGEGGEDGVAVYDNFKLSIFRTSKTKKIIYMGVE